MGRIKLTQGDLPTGDKTKFDLVFAHMGMQDMAPMQYDTWAGELLEWLDGAMAPDGVIVLECPDDDTTEAVLAHVAVWGWNRVGWSIVPTPTVTDDTEAWGCDHTTLLHFAMGPDYTWNPACVPDYARGSVWQLEEPNPDDNLIFAAVCEAYTDFGDKVLDPVGFDPQVASTALIMKRAVMVHNQHQQNAAVFAKLVHKHKGKKRDG